MNKLWQYFRAYMAFKMGKQSLDYSPLILSVEPTNVCNFKCSFCNQSDPEHFQIRKSGAIDVNNFQTILDKIKKESIPIKTINLTLDGEPTLHPELPDLIRRANEAGLFVRLSSNGYFVDADFLTKTANRKYLLSIDFTMDSDWFERNRGTLGSWQRVKDNLQLMVEHMKDNSNLFLEIVENSPTSGRTKKDNFEKLKNTFGSAKNLKYLSRIYHKVIDGKTKAEGRKKYFGCFYPWTSLAISWSGDVVTCCRDLDGRYVLGNVIDHSISEIWNNTQFQQLRESIISNNLENIMSCKFCDLPYDQTRHSVFYIIKRLLRNI